MNENSRRVLEMLSEGKVSVAEAERLLSLVDEQPETITVVQPTPPTGAARYLRVTIDSDEDERYVATAENGLGDALTLERLTTPLIESGYIPEEGLLLHDHTSEGTVEEKDDGLARLHHRGARSLSR